MHNIDEIAEFAIKEGGGLYSVINRQQLIEYIRIHLVYKTLLVVYDSKGITSVCRWNMDGNKIAHILDLIVRRDCRNRDYIKIMLRQGQATWPEAEYLTWERLLKYPNRKQRKHSIKAILRGGK